MNWYNLKLNKEQKLKMVTINDMITDFGLKTVSTKTVWSWIKLLGMKYSELKTLRHRCI